MSRARTLTVGAVLVVGSLLFHTSPVHAIDPTPCTRFDKNGFCIEWEITDPGQDGNDGNQGGGGGGGPAPSCWWATISDIDDPTIYADWGLDYPPPGVDIIWQEWRCAAGLPVGFAFRWIFPPTPGAIAVDVRARLSGRLPEPTVAASPVVGTASIVGVPVFVAVTNWTGVVSDSGCAGAVCVTVTATPTLRFSPGEPGTIAIACSGSGSRFDPAQPPKTQAETVGACAHAYRQRTGVSDRPAAWPGVVAVSWVISWQANTGETGSLPSVTRSTALPRSVQEVQTVIVGGSTP